jgi:hypothetical protein
VLVALAGLALALGGWVSFHYCFAAWRPDPDIFVTVELWRGVQRFGPRFLTAWAYTQDNWLLSLIPLSSQTIRRSAAPGFSATRSATTSPWPGGCWR